MTSRVPPLVLANITSDTHSGPGAPTRKHSLFSLAAQPRLPSPRKPLTLATPKPQSIDQSPRAEKSLEKIGKKKIATDDHATVALPSPREKAAKVNALSSLPPSEPATPQIAAHSEPVLKAVYKSSKVAMPATLLQKAEVDQRSKALAKLIVDDILHNRMKDGHAYKSGAIGASFYTENLNDILQPLVKSTSNKYVATDQLMQEAFADDFKANDGWKNAQNVYGNAMRTVVDLHRIGDLDALDHENQQLVRGKLEGGAEVIVRNLIGHPPKLGAAGLPPSVTNFLVYADQYFHEKLMQGDTTRNMSTEKMNETRIALQNNLLLNYLLKPMLEALAPPSASKTEKWFIDLALKTLSKHAGALISQILAQSFAQSPNEFREKVVLKHATEEQNKRVEQRIAKFKSNTIAGHKRSRSADTPLIDPRTMHEKARLNKKEEAQRKPQGSGKTMKEDPPVRTDDIDLQNFESELQDALDFVARANRTTQATPGVVTITTTSALADTLKTTTTMTTTTTTATAPAPVSAKPLAAASPRLPDTSADATQDH